MSSKDKSKTTSDKPLRDTSGKGITNKSRDNPKKKRDDDKIITNEERYLPKNEAKTEERRKHRIKNGDDDNRNDKEKKASVENKKTDYENYDEREERRRRRKEREKEFEAVNSIKSGKERDKHVLEGEKERKRSDTKDEYERSEKKSKKEKNNPEGNNSVNNDKYDLRQRSHKEESRHREEKDQSKNRHTADKEDSNSRNMVNKGDAFTEHRADYEEHGRQRSDKDRSNTKQKLGKDEDNARYKTDRDESKKTRRSDDNRKGSHRDRLTTDAKGDKRGSMDGNWSSDNRDNKNSSKTSEVKVMEQDMPEEYEEDFEGYNDDFEEVNSSSTPVSIDKEVQEDSSRSSLMNEPTQVSIRRQPIDSKPDVKKQDGIHTSFISFRMAQKKCSHNVIANKMLSRAFDLSRLIELDKSHFDIVDIAPVLEHSQYMLLFGRAGSQHIGSQTHDDNMAREVQTEVIDERTVWSQHPPLDDEGPVKVIYDTSHSHSSSLLSSQSSKTALQMLSENGVSSAPLIQILNLMDHVLEEEASPEVTTKISSTQNGQQPMSLGYNKYSLGDSLCTLATFAIGNSGIFATVHQKPNQSKSDKSSTTTSTISVWRVSSNNHEPQRELSCSSPNQTKSNITSIIFSPDSSSSHVIAGLESGLIALWDLREQHGCVNLDPPAYITASHDLVNDQSHLGSVISLHASSSESSASYQLLSLDITGTLSIWVVATLGVTQGGQWAVAAGSLADLNLRPGSRARINLVSTVSLTPSSMPAAPSITICMAVDPSNPSHIFVGTHDGQIIHHERTTTHRAFASSREHVRSRLYGSNVGFESAVITKLDCYPFSEPYLLAGYDDGTLQIFLIGKREPLLSLCATSHRRPIIECRWSRSHPAIVFSLDSSGTLNLWNVLIDTYRPVLTQSLPGYIGFDLSADSRWQHHKENNRVPINNSKARLLVWALDGGIEVHELHPAFVVPELDDCFKTCSFFQSLI